MTDPDGPGPLRPLVEFTAQDEAFEVGKYADLAVLSEDYLTVPDDRIRRIESVLTLVGGAVVHAASPFTGLLR